jgi:glucose-1-phosphate thymidylyltransferase
MTDSNQQALEFVGVLPAAGIASRLQPSRYLKELLPVTYLVDDEARAARPVPVISLSLRALKVAEVQRCVVTISDRKPELMRYLGDGSDFDLRLAYVQQSAPNGLAAAVDMAYEWTQGCYSCMLLPDTIVHPFEAMKCLRQVVIESRPDIVLGVFPTEMPEQLGPVRFDSSNRVLEVQDKPAITDLRNTWAMAIWSPRFSELLHRSVISAASPRTLGEIFNEAVQLGMDVRSIWFPEGSFVDIGTVKGLSQMLEIGQMFKASTLAEQAAGAAAGR